MRFLFVLTMALGLMASSTLSHAEVITFTGSSNSYSDFRIGYGSEVDWYVGLNNLTTLPTVQNGAISTNLHWNGETQRENSFFYVSSATKSLSVNSVTFNYTSDFPSLLYVYTLRNVLPNESLPSYLDHYGFTSNGQIIRMTPYNTNLSATVALSSGTSAVLFRLYDAYAFDISATLQITSMDITRVSPVPEPNTALMMMSGIGIMGFAARRRRKKLNA
ncbi:PEP-CTERM sorting domain-containing protein [Herbaspirillum frisingense]|uniref:PEP-CTERM sorting domain-containing protein n=1 Tax=Herbaspirillum frisingense TaxID=92645 RepID=UPI003B968626